jgi:hypothetical protein
MPHTGIQSVAVCLDRVGEGWHNRGMTNRIDHRFCDHPATRAGRAGCRRKVAEFFAPTAEDLARAALGEAEGRWYALRDDEASHPGQVLSAEINADDTAVEEGFEARSLRWFEVAYSTLAMLLDTGVNNYPDTQFK